MSEILQVSRVHDALPSSTVSSGLLGFMRRKMALGKFLPIAVAGVVSIGAAAQNSSYVQTNLISDGVVPANQTNPNLINPWGISLGTDFWIDAAGSGLSLVTDANGNSAFNVTVPAASATSAHGSPAGTVFNSNASLFMIPNNGSASFLFGTLDGTIAAWSTSTPEAVTVVNNSAAKASYTDIALATNTTGTFLLGANFAAGTVDVFDSSFNPTHLAGNFTDTTLPSGYAPFGIHSIGSQIFVTYAQLNPATGFEAVGAGLGYVDVFDDNGNFLQRAVSQGNLNAPWGMALAPSGFGSFGGDLLIGNFGDGTINVYNATSYAFVGQLQDSTGAAIANPGLWEIVFGTSSVGNPNTLYMAAGLNGGKDGVVAAITVAPPAAGAANFSFQASASTLNVASGQTGSLTLSLAGTNGFSGPVSFSCSGLPAGDSCAFSPATVTISGTGTTSVSLGIATAVSTPAPSPSPYIASRSSQALHSKAGMTLAFVGPFGLLALVGMKRKSLVARGSLVALLLVLSSVAMTGCSSSGPQQGSSSTPPAATTSQVTINATSGSITQSVTIALTVQ